MTKITQLKVKLLSVLEEKINTTVQREKLQYITAAVNYIITTVCDNNIRTDTIHQIAVLSKKHDQP